MSITTAPTHFSLQFFFLYFISFVQRNEIKRSPQTPLFQVLPSSPYPCDAVYPFAMSLPLLVSHIVSQTIPAVFSTICTDFLPSAQAGWSFLFYDLSRVILFFFSSHSPRPGYQPSSPFIFPYGNVSILLFTGRILYLDVMITNGGDD